MNEKLLRQMTRNKFLDYTTKLGMSIGYAINFARPAINSGLTEEERTIINDELDIIQLELEDEEDCYDEFD